MKVLLDISDSKTSFSLEVLQTLSFVKKVHPLSKSTSELFEGLKQAAEEVRLHKQGKIKLKTAQELLDEL
jgi:hypothetical protein